MYRIAKTLNHNSFIGVEEENNREYLVMGKGIAFGKKRDSVYSRETMPAFIPDRDDGARKCQNHCTGRFSAQPGAGECRA